MASRLPLSLLCCCGLLLSAAPARCQPKAEGPRPGPFPWPEGKHAAISLTFDDARPSQVDAGLPLLNRLGVKATFYLQPEGLAKRLEGWKGAVAAGHEIGNHTVSHPCTANFAFSRKNALEDYSLERIEAEMSEASRVVRRELGVSPVSFAYPCGQSFVGRGLDVRSYVPLVARDFRSGRGFLGEAANDPSLCDPAQLLAVALDGLSFDELRPVVEKAAAEGRWLILAGHDIGPGGFQTTRLDTLEALCRYARDPARGLWLDTVDAVLGHVLRSRAVLPAPARTKESAPASSAPVED